MVRTLTVEQVAERIGKSKKTVHSDMVRRPESLPRWFKLPGSRKPLWLESTVDDFLLNQAARSKALPESKNKKGQR